ncbi:SID1 transmembrane family member 1, partial [Orchesella cincta]
MVFARTLPRLLKTHISIHSALFTTLELLNFSIFKCKTFPNMVLKSFCYAVLVLLFQQAASSGVTPVIRNNAEFNKVYNASVNTTAPTSYIYQLPPLRENIFNTNVRLHINMVDPPTGQNLSIMILQPGATTSFRLPFHSKKYSNGKEFNKQIFYAERTLCILQENSTSPMLISVILLTESGQNLSYSLYLTLDNRFLINLDTERSIAISTTTPTYLGFQFDDPKLKTVKILADSNDANASCLTLSVQSFNCPVFDQEESVRYQGVYATMSSSATLKIKKEGQFSQGFIIVFIVHSGSDACYRGSPLSIPLETISNTSAGWIGPPTVSGTSPIEIFHVNIKIKNDDDGKNQLYEIFAWIVPNIIVALIGITVSCVGLLLPRKLLEKACKDIIFVSDKPSHIVCINRFAEMLIAPKKLKRNGNLFFYIVMIVAAFYCIPVLQFAVYYFRVAQAIGNYDMCYYNYRCAEAVGPFIDFNHLVSNLAYIILGIIFVISVNYHEGQHAYVCKEDKNVKNCKKQNCSKSCMKNKQICLEPETQFNPANIDEQTRPEIYTSQYLVELDTLTDSAVANTCQSGYGIPLNFGLFKGLGVALVIEGVLSAAYHLCPNQSTFQFDTCFMYVIAVLILVQMYQFRHPQILQPKHTFGTIVVIVVISVVGLLVEGSINVTNELVLAVLYLIVQFLVEILIAFNYCFLGYIKRKNKPVKGLAVAVSIFKSSTWTIESTGRCYFRFILPVVSLILSLILAVAWKLLHLSFSTYLLYFLISKVLWTILFYFFMKVKHGEFTRKSWIMPTIFFLLAAVTGGFAVKFYIDNAAQWEETAAGSRAMNQECLSWMGSFYDTHDVWHFYLLYRCILCSCILRTLGSLDVLNPGNHRFPTVIFFWDWICTSGTKYFTVAISLERFFVVAFPLKAHHLITPQRSKIFAATILAFIGALACFSFAYESVISPKTFDMYTAIVLHFAPFIIVLLFNILIILALRHHRKIRESLTATDFDQVSATPMLVTVVVVFGVCYSFEFVRRVLNFEWKEYMNQGTPPSRNHTHLDPESLEYWDFGMKEISTLDLPLVVELILRETGADKMHFICYSSGCGIYLAALVDVPELNDKFKAGFFLAPSVFFGSSYSPIMRFLRGIHGTFLESIFYRVMGGKITM